MVAINNKALCYGVDSSEGKDEKRREEGWSTADVSRLANNRSHMRNQILPVRLDGRLNRLLMFRCLGGGKILCRVRAGKTIGPLNKIGHQFIVCFACCKHPVLTFTCNQSSSEDNLARRSFVLLKKMVSVNSACTSPATRGLFQ